MKPNSLITLSAIALFCPSLSFAQQTEESSTQQNESEKPYEVVITSKPSRAYLRGLIEDVEEDFFEKFNEFNDDDMYDMYCYEYTPAMTHIKRRACEPLFMIKYRSQQSGDALFLMSAGGSGGTTNSLGSKLMGVYLPTEVEMRRHQDRYYKTLTEKLEEAVRTNQEIGEIASVMEQLKYRLEHYNEN